METKVYNQKAEEIAKLKLSDNIFAVATTESLVHQAMVAQMGNERQVLAHTKDRSEVRGGGKKPWSQKGTGRARAGSNRSPIWIGGGVTFGPTKDRNFKKDINRKMKRKALYMVLSDRIKNDNMAVLDAIHMEEFKTKDMDAMLKILETKIFKTEDKRSVLVINDAKEKQAKYSLRNLVGVKVINANNINILDLLKYKRLIIAKTVIEQLQGNIDKK